MARNKTGKVLNKLANRFRMGPVYLAACGYKLQRIREYDPFYSSVDIYLDADTDSDDLYIHYLSYESVVAFMASFMMDMGFELSWRYDANSSMVIEYVMDRVCRIAAEIGVPEIVPDVCDTLIGEINARKHLYYLVGRQNEYGN